MQPEQKRKTTARVEREAILNVAEFLRTLYKEVEGGAVEVAYIAPEGVQLNPHVIVHWAELPLQIRDESFSVIRRMNEKNYGIFFGVAVRKGRKYPEKRTRSDGSIYVMQYPRGTQKDALYLTALFADVDGGASDENLARVKALNPSIIVKSGGGYHGYLLLDRPLLITDDNREDVKRTLKGIAKHVGSDPHVAELARVLRLPDTVNTKPGRNGARCEVVEVSATRYPYADLFMQFAPLVAPRQRIDRYIPAEASEGLPKWVAGYLETGAPNGERNHRLYAVARAYNDAGLPMGQCVNEAGGRARADGLDDEEITRTIESAYAAPRSVQVDPNFKARMAGNDALIRNRREIEF